MSEQLSNSSSLLHKSKVVYWLGEEIDRLRDFIPLDNKSCQQIAQTSLLKINAARAYASAISVSEWSPFTDFRGIDGIVQVGDEFYQNAHEAIIGQANDFSAHAWCAAREELYDNNNIPEEAEIGPLQSFSDFLSGVDFHSLLSQWPTARKCILATFTGEWSNQFSRALRQLEREQLSVFGPSGRFSEDPNKPNSELSLEEFTELIHAAGIADNPIEIARTRGPVWPGDRGKLRKKQLAALEIIERDGPVSGKVLAKRIKVEETTFRRHYVPVLKAFGVTNDGDGYYVAPCSAT